MNTSRHFPNRDRLSVLTAVILLAYALTRFLDLPGRVVRTSVFGPALGFELSGALLMLVLVAALISAGSDSLIRSHPLLAGRSFGRTVLHWILPGATALALGAALNRAPNGPVWWLGLGLSALALLAVLVAEYIVVDRGDASWEVAALALTALAYALALLLFTLLHSLRARPTIAAALGGLTAASLAGRLFALKQAPWRRAVLYAGIVGLICAEAVWAAHYWPVTSGHAALVVTIPFYLSVGLSQQHLAGRLTRRVWIEFAVVGGLGLAIVLLYTLGGSR